MSEWDNIAEYWDLFSEDRRLDIEFWVSCATRFGSPILEFACGTGRLTLPMARAGVRIVGIDISDPMLRKARIKLKKEKQYVQKGVSLIHANANNFDLSEKQFSAILCPWGFPPLTHEDEVSLLKSVKKHLRPGGYFIVDEYNFQEPHGDWKSYYIKDYIKKPQKKLTLVRQVQHWGSAETRLGHFLYLWDMIKPDGTIKRIVTERTERIYTRKDIEQLIKENGFALVEAYGNYDKTQWSSVSPRTIIIARKK